MHIKPVLLPVGQAPAAPKVWQVSCSHNKHHKCHRLHAGTNKHSTRQPCSTKSVADKLQAQQALRVTQIMCCHGQAQHSMTWLRYLVRRSLSQVSAKLSGFPCGSCGRPWPPYNQCSAAMCHRAYDMDRKHYIQWWSDQGACHMQRCRQGGSVGSVTMPPSRQTYQQ